MNRFLRVLMLKVLVLLSLGSSAVWAECKDHETEASNAHYGQGELMIAATQSEGADEEDDASTDETDSEEMDEGDSQT